MKVPLSCLPSRLSFWPMSTVTGGLLMGVGAGVGTTTGGGGGFEGADVGGGDAGGRQLAKTPLQTIAAASARRHRGLNSAMPNRHRIDVDGLARVERGDGEGPTVRSCVCGQQESTSPGSRCVEVDDERAGSGQAHGDAPTGWAGGPDQFDLTRRHCREAQ